MKKAAAITASVLIVILVLSATLLLLANSGPKENGKPQTYVGITYCGNTVDDGKLLIDKVKGYTNLFVLQSWLLQRDFESVNELGDYAVAAGMYFLPYFGSFIPASFIEWLDSAKQKWGDRLLGVYYGDEPGGKMLDSYVEYKDADTGDSITKTKYGDIVVEKPNGVIINYELSGVIRLYEPPIAGSNSDINSEAAFYSNGTTEITNPAANGFSFKSYQELMAIKPFKDLNETAQRFYDRDKNHIEFLKNHTQVFTSDYGLYYFDYSSGYDVVFGQIGWNLSVNQQLSLMRGAANQQGKEWGVVITWKTQTPPYLDSKTEILNQLTTAYECGANYFVVFNYYDDDSSPYGTMQAEHFEAVESFWKNVVNNPEAIHDSVKADTVVVFPKNYGWGTRWEQDHIWGIFNADKKTEQIWITMQQALQEAGLKVDIVYADVNPQFLADYQRVYRCDG